MIDPKALEIVNKIYLENITRDIIKDQYNLKRKQLSKIERGVIKEILLQIKEASKDTK